MSAPQKEDTPTKEIEGSQGTRENGEMKSSWVKVIKNMAYLSNHVVEVRDKVNGYGVVEVPDEVIQHSVLLWDDFLEGKFMADALHVAKIQVMVNKIWPLGEKSIRIDVFIVNKTTVTFRIKDKVTRLRVLRRRMWNIADIPLIISKWSPIVEEEEPKIKVIPMWITLKNVPHKMFSWSGIGFIASAVGKPIRLHPKTELCSDF